MAQLYENALLSNVSTFRLGGPARRRIDCSSPDEVCEAVNGLRGARERYVLMGGGSNLLFSDEGFDGTVIRFVSPEPAIEQRGDTLRVGSGTSLDALAAYSAEQGLEGLMCCTGIPGQVGGAVVGNAGAWGRQIGDVLEWAEVLREDGTVQRLPREEMSFAYRHSRFKETRDVVLSVSFNLKRGDRVALEEERVRILEQRREKHPDLERDPCIGSFFRNIEPSSSAGRRQAAGWFLEQAGAKQMRVGGARVYEKHANIIVKGEGGTAQDVRDLSVRMAQAVKEVFDLDLLREVRFLGPLQGEEPPANGGYY